MVMLQLLENLKRTAWRSIWFVATTFGLVSIAVAQSVSLPSPGHDAVVFTTTSSDSPYFYNKFYITDGTRAGTRLAFSHVSIFFSREPVIAPLSRGFVFTAYDYDAGAEILYFYRTGVPRAVLPGVGFHRTHRIVSFPGGAIAFGDQSGRGIERRGLIVSGVDHWGRSQLLARFPYQTLPSVQYKPVVVGNRVVFFAQAPGVGLEPWVTDGTTAGTFLLADICRGVGSSPPPSPVFNTSPGIVHEGRFYFWANNCVNGEELWVTDGTKAGTYMIADLCPGPFSSSVNLRFVPLGRRVALSALTCPSRAASIVSVSHIRNDVQRLVSNADRRIGFTLLGAHRSRLIFSSNLSGEERLWSVGPTGLGRTMMPKVFDGTFSRECRPFGYDQEFVEEPILSSGTDFVAWADAGARSGCYEPYLFQDNNRVRGRRIVDATPGPFGTIESVGAAFNNAYMFSGRTANSSILFHFDLITKRVKRVFEATGNYFSIHAVSLASRVIYYFDNGNDNIQVISFDEKGQGIRLLNLNSDSDRDMVSFRRAE